MPETREPAAVGLDRPSENPLRRYNIAYSRPSDKLRGGPNPRKTRRAETASLLWPADAPGIALPPGRRRVEPALLSGLSRRRVCAPVGNRDGAFRKLATPFLVGTGDLQGAAQGASVS